MTAPNPTADLNAYTIWPQEAIRELCANSTLIADAFRTDVGSIIYDGKSCCIVGALNLAAAKIAKPAARVVPLPNELSAYTSYVEVTGNDNPYAKRRIGLLIKRWDSATPAGRGGMYRRMCSAVKV